MTSQCQYFFTLWYLVTAKRKITKTLIATSLAFQASCLCKLYLSPATTTASSPEHFFTLECQSLITSVKFRLETEGYWNTGLRILSSGPYSPFLSRLQIKPNIIVSLYKRIQIFILGTLGVFLFKCCFSWYFLNTVDTESLQT